MKVLIEKQQASCGSGNCSNSYRINLAKMICNPTKNNWNGTKGQA
jgi:hypothetical protein